MSQDKTSSNNSNNNSNSSNDFSTILLKFEVSSMGLGSGEPFVVRVKPKTKWEKVITAFGRQFGVDTKAFRFTYDGETIQWSGKEKVGQTLSDIGPDEAAEGVTIDVHAEAIGGN